MQAKLTFYTLLSAVLSLSAFADFADDVEILKKSLYFMRWNNTPGIVTEIAERRGLTDDEMAERLMWIADSSLASAGGVNLMSLRAVIAVGYFSSSNALPRIERYFDEDRRFHSSALGAYSRITKCDGRYWALPARHGPSEVFGNALMTGRAFGIITRDDRSPGYLTPEARLELCRQILAHAPHEPMDKIGFDLDMVNAWPAYTNSRQRLDILEHVMSSEWDDGMMYFFGTSIKPKEFVYAHFSNELARLRSVPPNELVDLMSDNGDMDAPTVPDGHDVSLFCENISAIDGPGADEQSSSSRGTDAKRHILLPVFGLVLLAGAVWIVRFLIRRGKPWTR